VLGRSRAWRGNGSPMSELMRVRTLVGRTQYLVPDVERRQGAVNVPRKEEEV